MKLNRRRMLVCAGVLVVLGLLALTALLRGFGSHGATRPGSIPAVEQERKQSESHQTDRDLSALDASELPTRREATGTPGNNEAPELPITELMVHVSWDDGSAAPGIGVGIRGKEEKPWAFRKATTDEFGLAKFQPKPGRIVVAVDRADAEVLSMAVGESKALDITLPRGNDVDGTVVTSDGRPVQGARIFLYDPKSELSPCVVAHSDPEGRFSVRSVVNMTAVCAEATAFSPSPRVVLQSHTPGYTHTVELVLGSLGGSLIGRVSNREGIAIAGALVTVGDWPLKEVSDVRSDGTEIAPYLPRGVLTKQDGTFLSEGLASGPQAIRVQAEGYGYLTSEVVVPAGSMPGKCEIELDYEAIIRGTVRDAGGRPIADVMVHRDMASHFPWKTVLTHTNTDGSFELGGLPAGSSSVFARKGRASTTTKANLVPGQTLVWDPIIDLGLSVSGRVSVPAACEQEFVVDCWSVTTGKSQSAYLQGTGDFAFHALGPEPHFVRVNPRMSGLSTCYQQQVNPGDPPLAIEIDCALLASIRIVGRVVWSKGNIAELRIVPFGPGLEQYVVWNRLRPDGSFDIGRYLPGDWRIEVRKGESNETLLRTTVMQVAANETLDLGTLMIQD